MARQCYGLILSDPSLSSPLKCMQFGIIFGAMLARLLHMVGTELKMILNVSASHLLSVMTRGVFCFFPPLSFLLFLSTLCKNKDKECLSFLPPVNHNSLLKLHSRAPPRLCGGESGAALVSTCRYSASYFLFQQGADGPDFTCIFSL